MRGFQVPGFYVVVVLLEVLLPVAQAAAQAAEVG